MKRFISLLALAFVCSVFAYADAPQASLVLAKHHVKRHHAHKAAKHHTPKHRHNSI